MPCLRSLGILCTLIFLMACTTTSEPAPDIPSTVAAPVQLQLAATPAPPPPIDTPYVAPKPSLAPLPAWVDTVTPLPPNFVMPPLATPPLPTPLPYVVVAPPTPVITPFFVSPPEPTATSIPYPTVPAEAAVMATMEPFPTAAPVETAPAAEPILEHPVAWTVRNPRDGLYSVNLPADWEHDESREHTEGQVFLESFADPGYTAQLTVVDYPPRDDYDVSDAFADLVSRFDEVTGFEVVAIDEISDEVIRVIFLYDVAGPGSGCEVVTFYGILAVTTSHSYHLALDICSPPGVDFHRADFAAQVIDGFTYPVAAP